MTCDTCKTGKHVNFKRKKAKNWNYSADFSHSFDFNFFIKWLPFNIYFDIIVRLLEMLFCLEYTKNVCLSQCVCLRLAYFFFFLLFYFTNSAVQTICFFVFFFSTPVSFVLRPSSLREEEVEKRQRQRQREESKKKNSFDVIWYMSVCL